MEGRAETSDLPTILLAEKDDSLRRLLGVLLAEEGYRVLGAGTRQAVLAQLRAGLRIDLVIADRGIPGMPAWDVVQEAHWCRPGVPCVRLIESQTDAREVYGVDPTTEIMLQRPVTIVDLMAAMEGLLSRKDSSALR